MPSDENEAFSKLVDEACRKVQTTGAIGITAFKGMGGIGKTTLAKGIYNRLAKEYLGWRGHISFDLTYTEADTNAQLYKLLTSKEDGFGQNRQDGMDVSAQLRAYLKGRTVLLMFDNVTTINQVDRLRGVFKHVLPGSCILFTSRYSCFTKEELLTVDLLSTEASYLLLCESAKIVDLDKPLEAAVRAAAEACAGLPLTLKLFGSYMQDNKYVVSLWEVRLLHW